MENPLDGAAPSPSTLHTPGLLNMNHFTLDLDLSPAPDSHLLVPQSSAAKQPKKRKSWGQALPEPKTSLPPRKRAKTDDEKEQRRIERIKRNRAAAHNSRERKRVEAERLEVENIRLKHQLASMQQHLLRQHAQLTEFQRLVPNALPQLSSEDFASMTFDLSEIKEESSSNAGTPASSVDTSVDTIDPRASFSESTPLEDMSTPFIKAESPAMSMTMPTPSVAPATGASLDQTQHSAAMLYDLQCQSSKASPMLESVWWAQVILRLMHMNIMACYRTLLAVSWTLWPARITRIMDMTLPSTTSSRTCLSRTSSAIATTRTTRASRQQRIAPSATSTTPSSLLSYLSQLLQSQTSAQFFLAKGLQQEDASAARLALLSKLAEQREMVAAGETEVTMISHLHGRSGRYQEEDGENGNPHESGGVG